MKNALILTLESEILLRLIAYSNRNGCSTSEDLFWKLDALQSFIHDLHWPDAEFARHLEQRLKLMACDMIESCIQRCYRLLIFFTLRKFKTNSLPTYRTENAFQQWLKKGVTFNSTDYVLPAELCAMVNVILDAKQQSFKLCAVDGVDVVILFLIVILFIFKMMF
jgi:hypothetical protein